MEISGFIKASLIDYPQKVAAVVFTQGCNFRCGFCHNPSLIPIEEGSQKEEEIIKFLEKRIGKLDGVVITGGEPTIQKDLVDFIKKIKKLNFLVKLDTNGSNPNVLESLIREGLVDYVAMDVKGPLEKYEVISNYMNTKFIQDSIDILKKSGIAYEFRTTTLPYYHQMADYEKIGKLIQGATLFTLQGFRPEVTFDDSLKKEKPFRREELQLMAEIMRKYVKEVRIHDNL